MAETLTPDLCVIGAGSAGLSAAALAAAFGVPCVLVERARMGGECLNVGCVPSKALLAAAHAAQSAREAGRFGIEAGPVSVDFPRVMAHVREVISSIAPTDSAARYTAMGVRVLRGEAAFTGPRAVAVGETTVKARRFIIASGSRPMVPDIPGLSGVSFLTNETVFDLDVLPAHLLVLGAGPVGLELAQAFRRLGSEVTVVGSGAALARIDPEIAAHAVAALRAEGVTLHEGARVTAVRATDEGGVALAADRERGSALLVEGTHLLVAAGRIPTLDGLGLDAAGVRHDRTGILVDKGMRTSNRRIYAVGDCVGGDQSQRFTHVAGEQAGLAFRGAVFRLSGTFEPRLVPATVYTDPEIAAVGLQEEEARRAHKTVTVLRFPLSENDRARAERLTRGEIKLICTGKGAVIGASIVGARAGELIVPWTLALRKGLDMSDFRDMVMPYPTFSEISKRAAVSFYAPQLRRPALTRLVRLLRVFG
jgi:pyruvate/2-oxoglutarate dehydrogenase complex dihydrolipoamide dehydrogenase (E3) component